MELPEEYENLSPSEFYRRLRPENFSDSRITETVTLPKEVLAFELEKITTNQKENDFEVLGRRMAEKLIAPNLIPQTGPTGGGDGKTDTETYPVSESIAIRWYIPENGWTKDEKWAFAISAKKQWKSKLKKDIESILSTKRAYTCIYFITNQTPSSKKKKDAQDEYTKLYNIDVVILDGKWILEKTYSNNLINIVVESLNLSDVYRQEDKTLGTNDTRRQQRLDEIEEKINNPNRYLEYDYQLVEDALEAVTLTRQLEKPRQELEAKFDRVERFLNKYSNEGQWIRFLYQKAWTYINYYDDYSSFFVQFEKLKEKIKKNVTIVSLEYYATLFTLYRTLYWYKKGNVVKKDYQKERKDIYDYLGKIGKKNPESNLSLTAKTHLVHLKLFETVNKNKDSDALLNDLKGYLLSSEGRLEFPFESFEKMIVIMGDAYAESETYDDLFETLTKLSEIRNSHLQAGELNIKRGGQKMAHHKYRDALIYFGKAVVKLSKEESRYGFYLATMGLSEAYNKLGLYNASYSSKISAISHLVKPWLDSGKIDPKILPLLQTTVSEEILYGRFPHILSWHELYQVVHYQLAQIETDKKPDKLTELDAFLTVRLMNGKVPPDVLKFLPSMCEREGLLLSEDVSFFLLGYLDEVLETYKQIGITTTEGVEEYFHKVADQPLLEQCIYEMNWFHSEKSFLKTTILGSDIELHFDTSSALIIVAETLLAVIEGFFGTSLENIYPTSEKIIIEIKDVSGEFKVTKLDKFNSYVVAFDSSFSPINDYSKIWELSMHLIIQLCTYHFLTDDPKEYIQRLFEKEEINERLSILLNHKIFLKNVLGENPKLTFSDWITSHTKEKPMLREEIFIPKAIEKTKKNKTSKSKEKKQSGIPPLDAIPHNKRKVVSVINNHLWDEAQWKGVAVLAFQDAVGFVLGFSNMEYGNKIFEDWINRIGNVDKDNLIQLSIVTEVDDKHPYWYRVLIAGNLEKYKIDKDSVLVSNMRFHEMNPTNPNNLNMFKEGLSIFKKFKFYPGHIDKDYKVKVNWDLCIEKSDITFMKASEIKESDIESAVLKKPQNIN